MCTINDCTMTLYARGMCKMHYYREWRLGSAEARPRLVHPKYRYDEAGNRACSRCAEYKPVTEFGKSKALKDGLRGMCKDCSLVDRLVRRYKLTGEQIDRLLAQDDRCGICGEEDATHVDHDHTCCPGRETCGKCVRGFLCRQCNARLWALETIEWREKAEMYLAEYGGKVE